MRKKVFKEEVIGISVLVLVTIFAGYMGCTKRFSDSTNYKVKTETKEYDGKNYNYDYYENDDYYGGPTYTSSNYYDEEYEYDYEGYKNYNYIYDYRFDTSVYNDKNVPGITYSSRVTVEQYEQFDPWEGIKASHVKFGDVTDYVEIIYNNLNVNLPGTYSIVYKACNYPGSTYCRTVTREVTVKPKVSSGSNNYSKGPEWSGYSNKSCIEGNTACSTNRLTEPTARDPYSNRELDVELINGYVDIYTPGTYVLVYYANTEHNISGTITRYITITKDFSSSDDRYDDDYNYTQKRKYISNYDTAYYDDGTYSGYLSPDNNGSVVEKYISDYKWTNNVSYTFRCENQYEYGTNGWTWVSTNTSDDHPTYNYDIGGFKGTLYKTSFYCIEGQGCEYDLNKDLGTCSNVGETKTVYRKWVGLYSGYVYSNQRQTYSGYVYSYR